MMLKRKVSASSLDDADDEDCVPIPIQFFFWNQTSLFIKKKFGNLTEAHALNFERVLVQNILHGLSPGLSDAISSISRWSFIKASFPHIMHACAASLIYRQNTAPDSKLGKTDTKLLYTLHWLILDAASECEDNRVAAAAAVRKLANKNKRENSSTSRSRDRHKRSLSKKRHEKPAQKNEYMHSIATIQLFVYLFVPIAKSLQPDDLDNLKLLNGLKIWEPLWAHRTPDIPIFNTLVKPMKKQEEEFDQTAKLNISSSTQQIDENSNRVAVAGLERTASDLNKINLEPKTALNISTLALKDSTSKLSPYTSIGIYMGDQPKSSFSLMPPVVKRTSVSSVNSSQFDSKEKKISLTNSSSSISDTASDTPIAKTDLKNLEIDSIQVSEYESDQIRDSDDQANPNITNLKYINIKKKPDSRAPIVHMNSICNFSETSTPTPQEKISQVKDCGVCQSCKGVSSPRRHSTSSSHTSSWKNCQSCFQIANHSDSFSAVVITEVPLESKLEKTDNVINQNLSESAYLLNENKSEHPDSNVSVDGQSNRKVDEQNQSFRKKKKLKQINENVNANTRYATYFDVAVMRCLLSSKWNTEGCLWALEFLCYRVSEITDFTIREQDAYFDFRSTSMPLNIDEMCMQMGIGSPDETSSQNSFARKFGFGFNNQFVDIINQIYAETDFTSPNNAFMNLNDYSKRKKFEANFHTRIRRIKYIDDDLQPKKHLLRQKNSSKQANNPLPTTPFSINELQNLNLENSTLLKAKKQLRKDFHSTINSFHYYKWPKELEEKLHKMRKKLKSTKKIAKKTPANKATPVTNLSRQISYSDTNINYKDTYEDTEEEVSGATGLINADGTLNLHMILKGAHSVILKENSFKLCELVLNILENLMNIDILCSEDIDIRLEAAKKSTSLSESSFAYLDTLEAKLNENFYLAIDLAMRNIKWLGCTICQVNMKNFLNDQLRGKIKFLLGRLEKKNPKRFKNYFKLFINNNDINFVMDTFHALFGYCYEPNNGLGHYSPYITLRTKLANSNISTNLLYASNFGNQTKAGQEACVNIESVMFECILKPLIKRLIDLKFESITQENLYLLNDIRSLLSYVKENYGGMFRKLSFSCLLDPLIKLRQENQERSIRLQQIDEKLTELKQLRESFAKLSESSSTNSKPIKFFANDQENQENDSVDESGSHVLRHDDEEADEDEINDESNEYNDDAGSDEDSKTPSTKQHSMSQLQLNEKIDAESPKVKRFFPKMSIDYNVINFPGKYIEKLSPSMKTEAWSNIKKISDLKKLGKKVKKVKNSSTTNTKLSSQKNTSTTSIHQTGVDTEKQADTISMNSSHFLSVIHAKFNSAGTASENKDTCSMSNTSSVLQIEFQVDSRNPSLKKKFPNLKQANANLSLAAAGNSGNSILCDSSLKELKKYQTSLSNSRSSLRDEEKNEIEILDHVYELTLQHRKKIVNERRFVDVNIVFKGIEYLRFLMESLPPATVPDVPFMSAVLEIEAPVISKAAFLLETAYFVHRCNKKDWPNWIKTNIGSGMSRPCGSSGSLRHNQVDSNKRNRIYQLAAANMFFSWAEVLAEKLETILDAQEKNKQLNRIFKYDMTTGSETEIVAEDFYDEGLINPDGNNCPFALQNIICLLLLEVTSFLRETYQYMPKKLNAYSNQNSNQTRLTFEKRPSRDNRTQHNNSVNESNNPSITGPLYSHENTSTVNLNLHSENAVDQSNENPNDPLEHSKHISFKFHHELDDNEINRYSLDKRRSTEDSNELSQENINRLNILNNSHNANKRNSITKQAARPSLKYRTEKSSRNSLMSGTRRSTTASISINENDILDISSEKNSFTDPAHSNDQTEATVITQNETLKPGLSYLSSANYSTYSGRQVSAEQEMCEVDEVDLNRCFPWIKVVVRFLSSTNYSCQHQNDCSTNCFMKQFKSSHCLIEAVLRMYETSANLRAFEREEKEKKEKEQQKKNNSLSKTASYRKSVKEKPNSGGKERSNSISSSVKKISYLNSLLKRNNLINQNQAKAMSANLNNERLKKEMKMNLLLSEKLPTIDYICNQIQYLNQIPLLLICKSVLIINDEFFADLIKISWNLLLNSDQEIASSAAIVFIIGAIKQPIGVEEILRSELKNPDVNVRFKSLLKFENIWKFRYHLWPRLESNAQNLLKISPPCIEFVLPSPPVGVPFLQPVDPPWMPKMKAKVEEATINQKEVAKAVVTASKSRKKHQQEIMQRALEADELNKKIAREKFLLTSFNYLQSASYEPLMHQTKDEPEEVQSKTVLAEMLGFNRKSIYLTEGAEEGFENVSAQIAELQQSQAVFPASISTSVVFLIDLLMDYNLNSNNQSVSALADKIVWNCLVEDAALFLRYFFEKITQKDKKNILIQNLRRLLSVYTDLPPQTAYIIFNYLLGLVMFYARSPCEGSQESVASILTLIWQIVSNVNGIVFKDLKQTLKKEQCDPSLLITANVPFAKKLIVHGPDLSQIPTQSNIFEETQFLNIMQESFEFFGIPELKRDKNFLFDIKTNQIHLPDTYVRNFYFFRRNVNPQLGLVQMDQKEGIKLQEKTALNMKAFEQSKVLFFRRILEGKQAYATAAFLNDELIKLPMFPSKALEADFNLFPKLIDRELLTTDMLHKYSWCRMIWSLFSAMDSKSVSSWDISLFLNVVNGSFILHCEDLNMIRNCLAIYIKTARHFQHLFATNGFLLIVPSLIKVYSNTQINPALKNAIEFTCLQFYIMHRVPFILQLFGSVSQILDLSPETSNVFDTNKIQASCFFDLLLSMETTKSTDHLKILELVKQASFNSSSSTSTASPNTNIASENLEERFTSSPVNTENIEHKDTVLKENQESPKQATSSTTGFNNANLSTINKTQFGHAPNSNSNTLNRNNANQGGNSTVGVGGTSTIAASEATTDNYNNMIKALDLCYIEDDPNNNRFAIINAINLCVTVVAYATHASRANQMMVILDAITPRYLQYLKSETNKAESIHNTNIVKTSSAMNYHQEVVQKARAELISVQKISVAIKTLVNNSDHLTRTYAGPRTDMNTSSKINNNSVNLMKSNKSKGQSASFTAVILPDENSNKQPEEKKTKNNEFIDEEQMKKDFRLPRDVLLNIVSEFIYFGMMRSKDLYKITNDLSLKVTEFLDGKSHFKLVEIVHALLKLWDETNTLNGNGLQKSKKSNYDSFSYFRKLIPICNWNEEDLKPAFNNLLRRIDRLFTKISKRPTAKKQLDWAALSGILEGLYLTLDKDETICNVVYFRLLINSTISLILNEPANDISLGLLNTSNIFSTASAAAAATSKIDFSFQIPIVFSKSLIKLVGRYINSLKDQSALEQLFGGSNTSVGPNVPSGLSYMINFVLPLLIWSASDRRESPKLNATDISFILTIILNALKPPSKLAATLLLSAPKQHNLSTAFEQTTLGSPSSYSYNKSAKQLKDILTQSTFLALKLITYFFCKQADLAKIALTLRQLFTKQQAKGIFLWRYVDFMCTNRSALFLLLKPFIETFISSQICENEQELQIRDGIKLKLSCLSPTNYKCNGDILTELNDELAAIKSELQDDVHSVLEKRVSISKDVNINEIPSRSHLSRANETAGQKSAVSSPSKTIGFKFNKSKKDLSNNENSGLIMPRKKLEKINYKSGIDILEAYKARCALLKNDMNRVNLENNNSEKIDLIVARTTNLNSMGIEIVDLKETEAKPIGGVSENFSVIVADTAENDSEDAEDLKSLQKILEDLKNTKNKEDKKDSDDSDPSLMPNDSNEEKNKIIFV